MPLTHQQKRHQDDDTELRAPCHIGGDPEGYRPSPQRSPRNAGQPMASTLAFAALGDRYRSAIDIADSLVTADPEPAGGEPRERVVSSLDVAFLKKVPGGLGQVTPEEHDEHGGKPEQAEDPSPGVRPGADE